MKNLETTRLKSLDILRGVDLFLLVCFCPLLVRIPYDAPWFGAIKEQFRHVPWEGFTLWDLVMPLFMFMSGVTIPFAFARYRREGMGRTDRVALCKRMARRIFWLWILGMVVQGNLLSLDPSQIKLFSNTLQAIAVGYLFSTLLFLNCRARTNYGVAAAMLLLYWATLTFGGDFTPAGNLAEQVDRAVLGVYRDGARLNEQGVVEFATWYHYTWVLTSLSFIVMVAMGMFAGDFVKNSPEPGSRKSLKLATIGGLLVTLGWLWHLQVPVIKPIYSPSMVLVSGGYCLLALTLFYWVVDVKGWSRGLDWLRIYGTNSIVAYVLFETRLFNGVARTLLYGTEQYVGDFYPLVLMLGNVTLLFLLLWVLFRNGKFLRI